MARNIKISGSRLPENLRHLRTRKLLSKPALAERAGVTYKTIHNIEEKSPRKILEETLFRLARALDVEPEDLLNGVYDKDKADTTPSPRRPAAWKVVAGLGAPIFVGALVWFLMIQVVDWRVSDLGRHVEGINRLGMTRWTHEAQETIAHSVEAPWNPGRYLVYGLAGKTSEAGQLVVCRVSNGDTLWTDRPHRIRLEEIFTHKVVRDGGFSVSHLAFADLAGDGQRRLVATFRHNRWYPEYVKIYDREGRVLGSYYHTGHLNDMRVGDIDGDGKDEIVFAGTNNKRRGATLLILDEDHCSGGSVDEFVSLGVPMEDGSLVREIIPDFADSVMQAMESVRIRANDLAFVPATGDSLNITADVGIVHADFSITFDCHLHPITAVPTDEMTAFVHSLSGRGLLSDDFLSPTHVTDWLDRSWRHDLE